MAKKKRKLSKKNRNSLSGILVGLASIYAVSVYLDISREQLGGIFISSLLLFSMILILAILTIVVLKLAGRLIQKMADKSIEDTEERSVSVHPEQQEHPDTSARDKE